MCPKWIIHWFSSASLFLTHNTFHSISDISSLLFIVMHYSFCLYISHFFSLLSSFFFHVWSFADRFFSLIVTFNIPLSSIIFQRMFFSFLYTAMGQEKKEWNILCLVVPFILVRVKRLYLLYIHRKMELIVRYKIYFIFTFYSFIFYWYVFFSIYLFYIFYIGILNSWSYAMFCYIFLSSSILWYICSVMLNIIILMKNYWDDISNHIFHIYHQN